MNYNNLNWAGLALHHQDHRLDERTQWEMPVAVNWYDEQETIIKYTYATHWTWEELRETLEAGRALQREKPYSVSVIHDLIETVAFPPSMISNMKHHIGQREPNIGMVAFVSKRMLATGLFRILKQLFPNLAGQYIHTTNVEEAIKQIRQWQAQNSPDITS